MDRSIATGTGFVGQYSNDVQKMYESLANTPDALVLFFHHVPYTYKLHSGRTVIKLTHDSHYDKRRIGQSIRRKMEITARPDR